MTRTQNAAILCRHGSVLRRNATEHEAHEGDTVAFSARWLYGPDAIPGDMRQGTVTGFSRAGYAEVLPLDSRDLLLLDPCEYRLLSEGTGA